MTIASEEQDSNDEGGPGGVLVLIPIHDDWESARLLLGLLDRQDGLDGARVVLIDDGSTVAPPPGWGVPGLARLGRVDVLELRRNLGHQRALAVGLAYVEGNIPCRAAVVMDGDGEDDPADVPRLLRRLDEEGGRAVVFAERTRRVEGLGFRLGYVAYRGIHRLLTGIPVQRIGNFSAVPGPTLRRLVVVSDLWNHYVASVLKTRLPYVTLPTRRAPRLAGESHMDFVALVTHGLSAISVFGDRVGVRLLVAAVVLLGLVMAGMAAIVFIRLGTTLAIPGWATAAAGALGTISVQLITLLVVFVFIVLGQRESSGFLPARDYPWFVSGLRRVA
jgi:hypothetical protein